MAIFNLVWWGGWQPIEIKDWLCFTANTASSTVKLNKTWTPTTVTLETSTDYWQTWSTYTFGDTITLTNVWDKVFFRNTSETDTGFSADYSNYYNFVMTGSINASWDVNFLLNKNSTNSVSNYCFYKLFDGCSSLKTAPSLPALVLGVSCYEQMFAGTWIKYAPELPATSLNEYCYDAMFYTCSSLIIAPSLPLTNLWGKRNVYSSMFHFCTNLVTLPKLPATSLSFACYGSMFYWCSKIRLSTTQTWDYQTAYRIPTTWTWTAGNRSLNQMFDNTGWTFTGTPSINRTYYTSNPVV